MKTFQDAVTRYSLTTSQADAASDYFAASQITLRNPEPELAGDCPISSKVYFARINLDTGAHSCTCRGAVDNARPYPCKHALAVLMAYENGQPVDTSAPVMKSGVHRTPRQSSGARAPRGEAFRAKVSRYIGAAIEKTALLVQQVLESDNIPFMVGPTGCGKTSAVEIVAQNMGFAVEHFTGSESWGDADLVGLKMQSGDILGVIGRAFDRAQNGDTVIIFLDEFLRCNARVQAILMNAIQSRSPEFMLQNGIDTDGKRAYIVEAPVFGRVWAYADNIKWVFGTNPWGAAIDPAFIRRVEPVQVQYSLDVLKPFDATFAAKVQEIWQMNLDGILDLPVEYQALAGAKNGSDTTIFQRYLTKLQLLDPNQHEAALAVLA